MNKSMEKYFIREQKEYGCSIYSVINVTTGNRVNYFPSYNLAKEFIKNGNESVKMATNLILLNSKKAFLFENTSLK